MQMQRINSCRHDWVGKMIHWEFCKWMCVGYTDQCCLYKAAAALEYKKAILSTEFSNVNTSPSSRRQEAKFSHFEWEDLTVDVVISVNNSIKLKDKVKKDFKTNIHPLRGTQSRVLLNEVCGMNVRGVCKGWWLRGYGG